MIGYVWRQLFQRKVRTALSMLGVSVAVAGIVALISVARGMRTSLDTYMQNSGASLTVFSRDVADLVFSSVSTEAIKKIRALEGVEAISRANFTMIKTPALGAGHEKLPAVLLFGRFPGERIMNKYQGMLSEGRLSKDPGEIMAGSMVAAQLGLKLGDKLDLFGRKYLGVREFEIVGLYHSDIGWENGGLIVHGSILAERLGRPDSFTLVWVYTAAEEAERVAARIEEELPSVVAVPAGEFTQQFANQLELLDDFIWLITIIALVIGILGVLNTMMMSVAERTREIGMLRALGWSRGLVMKLILSEGVLLSAVGGAFGLVLGVAGTETLIRLFPSGYLAAAYETATFVKGGLIALVVGVSAALYPAYRAANLRPVEALRYE